MNTPLATPGLLFGVFFILDGIFRSEDSRIHTRREGQK